MRAVRAARAALPALLARVLDAALPVFLRTAPDFLWAAADFVVFSPVLAADGLVVCCAGAASLDACPATGATASSNASPPASHRANWNVGFGEFATLISPLYADFSNVGRAGISPVTEM